MSKMLVVAARELQERWLLLPGGLALGCAWLLLPVFGLPKDAAPPVGLLSALLLGGLAALLAGATMFARDAGDGRLAFVLARPIAWPAVWGGKWIAAGLLAGASGLLASIPWMLVYPPPEAGGSSWGKAMADAQGWAFAVGLLLLIVGAANFFATAFRARSAWLAVDFSLFLAALWAVYRFLAPLVMVQVLVLSGWAEALAPVPLAGALLAGSASQLAIGRTDLQRAHRALSITFWSIVGALLLIVAGELLWIERATPADLRAPYLVRTTPDGRWLYVEGPTNRGGAYSPRLLVDAVEGRYLRTLDLRPAWDWDLPGIGFSADSRFAVRWSNTQAATRLTLLDLRATPPHSTDVALEASTPPSWLTSVCLSSNAEMALVVQAGSASLVALPSGRALATSTFPPGFHATVGRLRSATEARLWLARFDPGVALPATGEGEVRVVDLTAGALPTTTRFATTTPLSSVRNALVVDDAGERLLTRERGRVLRNGKDGTVLATLVESERADARFLADGRIVALSREGHEAVLRTFAGDGRLLTRTSLVQGPAAFSFGAWLGPEVRPGQIVVATGTAFLPGASLVVDVLDGRIVERLPGLRPAPTRLFAGDVRARSAGRPPFPPCYFVSDKEQVVRIDFATGERRVVTGPGAPQGQRLRGL